MIHPDVIADVEAETERAVARFHDPRHLHYALDDRLAILVEEVGEVAAALNDRDGAVHLYAELIQVASVAALWADAVRVRMRLDLTPMGL